MIIRDAGERDLAAIMAIYNHAVLQTTAVWNDTPVTLEERQSWLAGKRERGFPVLVAEVGDRLLGFASYGDFRPWPGYVHTIEHSVYVHPESHRQGVGRALMEALIEQAVAAGLHAMIGGIEAGNAGSLALHHALGFAEVGRLPEVGRKFDRWLDLVFMQRVLREAAD
ncbi:GNAT family N-acetyltransferase [Novosphingobium terrae]|uniref:GNAT family N-acetyltransferase n=1 Tax=Novosphingobium terrae TaxID=2726189 RepID=UPI00197E4AE7|nr:GNAT family N-acetyltransferase [Novosphingobium terrae]